MDAHLPKPANGSPTSADVWNYLAHPVWGLGALHTKIEVLNERLHNDEVSIDKRLTTIETSQGACHADVTAMETRLIAKDFNEAKFAASRLARIEELEKDKKDRKKNVHNWILERGIYIMGAIVAGIALSLTSKFDTFVTHVAHAFGG